MSYKSPFTFKFEDIEPSDFVVSATKRLGDKVASDLDQMTFTALRKCGVEIDKEELIRAMNYDRDQYNKGYEDGFRDGTEAATQWIPVTERLPEGETDVLAFCGTTGKFYETAYLCNGKWFACWDGTEIVCVTHWMPLPDAPKDGE